MDISDNLLTELKHLAAESHSTLRELIEDAVRAELARHKQKRQGGEAQAVVTFRGRGVHGGVNLDSMSDLLDIMGGAR